MLPFAQTHNYSHKHQGRYDGNTNTHNETNVRVNLLLAARKWRCMMFCGCSCGCNTRCYCACVSGGRLLYIASPSDLVCDVLWYVVVPCNRIKHINIHFRWRARGFVHVHHTWLTLHHGCCKFNLGKCLRSKSLWVVLIQSIWLLPQTSDLMIYRFQIMFSVRSTNCFNSNLSFLHKLYWTSMLTYLTF